VSELPIVRQAQRDLELGRLALAVFDLLRDKLDLREFRPIKLQELQDALDRSRTQVIGALRELVTRGYVEKGPLAWERGPRTYRLCYSKGDELTPSPSSEGPPTEKPKGYGMMSRGIDW